MKSKKLIKINQSLLRDHQKIDRDFFIEQPNVYGLFKMQAQRDPQKQFVIFPEYNLSFSYEDLDEKIGKRAAYLVTRNLIKGDRIALVLPTSPDFLTIYFAALRGGLVVVPINPDLSPPEIAYIIMNSRAKAVFYNESFSKKIFEVQKIIVSDQVLFANVVDIDSAKLDPKPEAADVHYTDEAVIIYTSGTTGNPKGVVLSHLNLLSDAQAIALQFQFSPATRTLCFLPLFHNNGQVVTLLAPLCGGGSIVMVPTKASLKLFWSLIKEYDVQWTSVMPAILAILLSFKLERKDRTMVGIICGGQILNKEVQTQFENTFHIPIFEGYGLTETASFASFNEFSKGNKPGTVGRALPVNDIAILDENDREMARDQVGEICIRGLNVMIEYFNLTEVNRKSLRGGWFHSGDYGYLDADGYLYFKTRKDYLIKKGGENIYPSEIENVLFGHPAVDECAAIGVPDKLLGQEIVAFVKLNSQCAEEELKKFFTDKLAHYKYPKRIIIINDLADLKDLPKGPTKKVLYRKLLDYYNQHLI